MPPIKSMAEISKKWVTVSSTRANDYADGIKNPQKDWATETLNAEEAYEEGVREAIAQKRFGTGVAAAGTAKWQHKSLTLGVPRWPIGIRAAEDDYKTGFAPFREVIERTVLPQRFARGDPRNIERVTVMAAALHTARVRQ